ncbi:hypothetical protein XENTR_v10016227 [Xenopus tropicalis]|nr:hypothetical protein XENTR_v10016227 [Xenopus tropicalis]
MNLMLIALLISKIPEYSFCISCIKITYSFLTLHPKHRKNVFSWAYFFLNLKGLRRFKYIDIRYGFFLSIYNLYFMLY